MEDTLNCSSVPTEISADPDIVGPGVMTAYFATAIITVATVILAYLFGGLEESYMSEFDYKVMALFQRKWRHLRKRHTNLAQATHSEPEAAGNAKRAAITQFILTLSDQQLVTGLAILIAGVSDPRRLTGYEFTIVATLAWFSSTTHLTTLIALRAYMDSHGIVRDVRVAGMVIVFVLLAYTVFLMPAAMNTKAQPIQCVYSNSVEMYPIDVVITTMALFQLGSGYLLRIQELYLKESHPAFVPFRLIMFLIHIDLEGMTHREVFQEILSEQRVAKILAFPQASRLRRIALSLDILYNESFIRTLPSIGFSLSYGLSQVVVYRWMLTPNLDMESTRMGYGQLIPILLLFLPALAAGETFYDYRNQRRQSALLRGAQPIAQQASVNSSSSELSTGAAGEELLAASRQFDKDVAKIQRYFYREIRQRITEDSAIDETEMLHRKADLVKNYRTIARFQMDLSTTMTWAVFGAQLTLTIALGILLNMGSIYELAVAGAVIFTMMLTLGLTKTYSDALALFRRLAAKSRSKQ